MQKVKVYNYFDLPTCEDIDYSHDVPLTQQQFASDVNINEIIRRSRQGAGIPAPVQMPKFMDLTGAKSLREMQEIFIAAEESFMEVDPEIRSKFGNDPLEMINWLSDARNAQEAVKLGLAVDLPGNQPVGVKSTVTAAAPSST